MGPQSIVFGSILRETRCRFSGFFRKFLGGKHLKLEGGFRGEIRDCGFGVMRSQLSSRLFE